jgi:uroporphyrinogen-III synthase
VTRAREQAAELAAALRSVGAAPVFEPMIELVPNDDPEIARKIATVIADLDRYRSIVFTSSNAVRFFARALQTESRLGVGLAPGTRTFCVGDRTAEAALAAGFPVHVVASGRSDAEALLGQLLQSLPAGSERVLVPGSQIARTVIADGLRAAGTEVDAVPFYVNRRPEIDVLGLRRRLVGGELFALTFTSPSTVDHFIASLDDESREAASQCMIAAIGRTTAKRLESVGLTAAVVPDRPDVSAMVAGLVAAAAAKGVGK